jgi:microcin C transport system substrate-binding protein
MKALAFNLRRPAFQDLRVRKIIASLYDFEFINDNFYEGTQDRLTSYFLRQKNLRARPGPAEGRVRTILEELAQRHNRPGDGVIFVPSEAIEVGPYDPGKSVDGSQIPIELRIQMANQELDRLGWQWDSASGFRIKDGMDLAFEINDGVDDGLFHFTQILEMAGIKANMANLSKLEQQGRYKNFRFDVAHVWYDGRNAPGQELARHFLSAEADIRGSRNLMGLKNPAIDEVLNILMALEDHKEVGIYARVFDRIMFANWYVIPKLWPRYDFGAYWNTMGQPEVYAGGLWYFYNVLWFWWEDADRREALEEAMEAGVGITDNYD